MKSARSIALEIVGHPNLMSRVGICDRADLAAAIEEAIVADRRERQTPIANAPPCHPGGFWICETPGTNGAGRAVCSVCGKDAA